LDYLSVYNKLIEKAKARNWRSESWRVGEVKPPSYVEDIGVNYNTVKKYLYNGKNFVLEFYTKENG